MSGACPTTFRTSTCGSWDEEQTTMTRTNSTLTPTAQRGTERHEATRRVEDLPFGSSDCAAPLMQLIPQHKARGPCDPAARHTGRRSAAAPVTPKLPAASASWMSASVRAAACDAVGEHAACHLYSSTGASRSCSIPRGRGELTLDLRAT